MSKVFAYSLEDRGSIPGRIIPNTQKMEPDTELFNTLIIMYRSRVKWNNPWNGVAPPLHLDVIAIEKGALGSPSAKVTNFLRRGFGIK